MPSAPAALRAAVHDALIADSGLAAALGGHRIYDEPPRNATFPYVTLGEARISDASADDGRGDPRNQQEGARQGMRSVDDAARDRHSLTRAEHERLAPLYLRLKPALEHEEEFILVLMLVPIDERTVNDREADYTVIHSRERLVEPRVVCGAFGGQVDMR